MTEQEKKLAFLLATSPHLDTVDGVYGEAARDLVANGVVPVVHCQDCEHCLINLKWNTALCMRTVYRESVQLDDFCSRGKRFVRGDSNGPIKRK